MNDIEDIKTQALFNEAGICAHLIGTGLTNIRKAHSAPQASLRGGLFRVPLSLHFYAALRNG